MLHFDTFYHFILSNLNQSSVIPIKDFLFMFWCNRELKGNTMHTALHCYQLEIEVEDNRVIDSTYAHYPEALLQAKGPIFNFHIRDVIYTTWLKDDIQEVSNLKNHIGLATIPF